MQSYAERLRPEFKSISVRCGTIRDGPSLAGCQLSTTPPTPRQGCSKDFWRSCQDASGNSQLAFSALMSPLRKQKASPAPGKLISMCMKHGGGLLYYVRVLFLPRAWTSNLKRSNVLCGTCNLHMSIKKKKIIK